MRNKEVNFRNSWHDKDIAQILVELKTSAQGLSQDEVKKRLFQYGENRLPAGVRMTLVQIILHQLLNPLIFILVLAAIASVAIGEVEDAIFIFLVIFINSALGAYQEFKAEKSASALQQLLKIKARVLRNGKGKEIPSEEVVPGDIILLESGIKVPADLRLLEANNLEIDESFLTGESIAAKKRLGTLKNQCGVPERSNMAFAGSTVMNGRGRGVAVNTGILTEVGKISRNVTESKSAKPPLVQRMDKFIAQIGIFLLVVSLIVGTLLYLQGMELIGIFFVVVALAVSAIPEGLPVALTVALSIATKRMAKRNVIVRKLNSVESLGSCTVIASDKTGTLTVNEQTAKIILLPDGSLFHVAGQGYNGNGNVNSEKDPLRPVLYSERSELYRICRTAVFANEALLVNNGETWEHAGDSMDVALLGLSYKLGLVPEEMCAGENTVIKIPYESQNKFSAAICHNEKVNIELKGAVETVLDFCDSMLVNGIPSPLLRENILALAEKTAMQGFRVLAFASGESPNLAYKDNYEAKDLPPLTLNGLVGFIDPLRPEARDAVDLCRKAGIKVIMITGDHPSTAKTLAGELGISAEDLPVITGKMLENNSPSSSLAFRNLVASSTVFARVSPTQKLEIVNVLIEKGEFVAVTGDGVNDAPALKRANIGVAMGSGTDVAKEVGSMIVVDDNFSSIVAGVEEGRFAYDNVRKVIYLLISTGAALGILFISSLLAGLPLPMIAVQLLWLNLVTNGIQDVALAFEGGEPGAMKRKPRPPSERIFNKSMIRQTLVASFTMATVAFGFWLWLNRYTSLEEEYARNLVLLLMVFMQNLHVFNCRSERISTFRVPISRNYILIFGVIAAQGIHILSMQLPFMQKILRIEPITFTEWGYILLLAIPILLVMEVYKFFVAKREKALLN
ncbi:HAD-IC family P-type ATPase [Antarcticibacterium arcticum]|uniref:HAD-IC family P-type ATPase n=1 Tax=Antarcticibacterium arcticum TaxID=2585771 RepID=A0A5B8YP88_9FLAO|nr:HAD-IC family P-type ATPase [Antarcticibacterium arcticum]QED38697.1 HAD-IC family P-type ATPase [Antarcticibacterium arcticum]